MKIAARPGYGLPRPLPFQEQIRDLLSGLLGRGCVVDKPFNSNQKTIQLVAMYVDKDNEVRACLASDLPFAAYAAAALSMVPAASANAEVEKGELSETLIEDFHEVANVLSRLFNGEKFSTLRLSEVVTLEDDRVKRVFSGTSRVFDVLIEGYGVGRMEMYAIG